MVGGCLFPVCFLKFFDGKVDHGSLSFSMISPLLLNGFEWWFCAFLSVVFDRRVGYGPFRLSKCVQRWWCGLSL